MKKKYFPTKDELEFLLQDGYNINIFFSRTYGAPYFYPCDEEAHFQADIMNILVLDTAVDREKFQDTMLRWWGLIDEINELHLKLKGRGIDYD